MHIFSCISYQIKIRPSSDIKHDGAPEAKTTVHIHLLWLSGQTLLICSALAVTFSGANNLTFINFSDPKLRQHAKHS